MDGVYQLRTEEASEIGDLGEVVQDGLDIYFDFTIPAKAVLIGNNEGCDIRVSDSNVKGLHALLVADVQDYNGVFLYDMPDSPGLSEGAPDRNVPVFMPDDLFTDEGFESSARTADLHLTVPRKNGGVTDEDIARYRAKVSEAISYHLVQVEPEEILDFAYRVKRGSRIYFCEARAYDGSQPSMRFGTRKKKKKTLVSTQAL